jgi:hypothetical protein
VAFPPAHFLVGAGVAELLRVGTPLPRWRSWLLAGSLAVSPDLDFGVGMLLGEVHSYHGTFTHSALAVIVVSLLGAIAGREWAVLAGAGYGSHLLVDLLDDRGRTNVLLGWPLTLNQPDAIARVFPTVPFEKGEGALHAALSLFQPEVLGPLLHQTAVGGIFFVALLGWAAAIRAIASRGKKGSPGRQAAEEAPGG